MGSRARGKAAARSLRSARGAAHSEGTAAVAVLAEHPSSIGTGKVLPKSTTDGMICWARTAKRFVTNSRGPIRDLLSPTGGAGEERLSHLDVARHSDTLVTLQRFIE